MLICFTSDLHGRPELYEELGELLGAHRPRLLVLGGDLFPDGDMRDPVQTQAAWVDGVFIPRVRAWRELVPGLAVACILGNHDWLHTQTVLGRYHDAGELLLLRRRPMSLNGLTLVGYSRTPPTPFWMKDFERLDLPDDPLPDTGGAVWDAELGTIRVAEPEECFAPSACMDAELRQVGPLADPWIFVCHAPPFATNLDRLPDLAQPVGSHAVRDFIERRRPMVSLHGHIHESPEVSGQFADRLGDALCINPGQGRRLHAVLLDSDDPGGTVRHSVIG